MGATRSIQRKRLVTGLALMGFAAAMPIVALLFPVFGLPGAPSNLVVGLLVAGGPEILCLTGIALLGKEGFQTLGNRFRLSRKEATAASKGRYYGCLSYCLLNSLPITLYAYTPEWMPGGSVKYYILALADLGFILSVCLMGGEFWEKFRRLFIWEGRA